ncbi:hypothetical protein [Streptomyces sp. GS7]|uniref:hypothetical protein n=1 Tax=Streptomyces sp. GS7 TaxID=2692234 RepID=UPI0013184A99|nr:hypothetical protein [Streptomyces sp. GS7]QHC23254.1 hypothetical protein GR130_19445 [Streptomyces sp. GS7]
MAFAGALRGGGNPGCLSTTPWLAWAGPKLSPRQPVGTIRHPDIVAQVHASLGCTIDLHWTLDRRPFGS